MTSIPLSEVYTTVKDFLDSDNGQDLISVLNAQLGYTLPLNTEASELKKVTDMIKRTLTPEVAVVIYGELWEKEYTLTENKDWIIECVDED